MEKDGLAVLEASSVCNLLQVLDVFKPALVLAFLFMLQFMIHINYNYF